MWDVKKWTDIIYFILILIILLYILYPTLTSSYNKYYNKHKVYNEEEDDVEEEDIDSEVSEINYSNYEIYDQNFRLKTINSDDIEIEENSGFKYKDFINIYDHPSFLTNYRDSLKISFNEKLKIYNKMLKELTNDLNAAQSRYDASNAYMGHDTNLQRLRRLKSEVESIINIINYRLGNSTIKDIKQNFKRMIYDKNQGFNSLIGRDEVKDSLALQIYTFSKNPRIFFNNFQNIIITGKSGVGKTKLADTIGFIYSKSGIFARHKFRCVTKQDFTSQYVNEASQLTRELLFSCLEGVIFIDEAYEIIPEKGMFGNNFDHGNEALTEMVNFWDKNIGLSCTIMGGYKKEMNRITEANEGVDRRFPYKLHLKKYNSIQLMNILLKFLHKSAPDIYISQKDANTIYTILNYLYIEDKSLFSKQAGDMLNLSSFISKSIYGNNSIVWEKNKSRNNSKLILNGFNGYLRSKGTKLLI